MFTQGCQSIINRIIRPESQSIYDTISKQLDEIVNYGSKILQADFDRNQNTDEDLAQLSLFRHTLDIVDSISQLLKIGSTDVPLVLLRNLFETLLSIEYILEKDTARRAISYLVVDRLSLIKAAKKLFFDTETSKSVWELFVSEGLLTQKGKDEDGKRQINELEKLLINTLKYKEIVDEKRKCDKARKGRDVSWFSLFEGPANIYELAKHLKKATHYEVLYRQWSSIVHASGLYANKFVFSDDNTAHMIQLRNPNNLTTVGRYTILFSVNVFRTYIKNRVPLLVNDFANWYINYKENVPILSI